MIEVIEGVQMIIIVNTPCISSQEKPNLWVIHLGQFDRLKGVVVVVEEEEVVGKKLYGQHDVM